MTHQGDEQKTLENFRTKQNSGGRWICINNLYPDSATSNKNLKSHPPLHLYLPAKVIDYCNCLGLSNGVEMTISVYKYI